jgi:hypothetical protein
MDSLVALEIVIPVEGLGALIAFEGALVLARRRAVAVHMMVRRHVVGAIAVGDANAADPLDKRHLAAWVGDIAHDGSTHTRHVTVGTHVVRRRLVLVMLVRLVVRRVRSIGLRRSHA